MKNVAENTRFRRVSLMILKNVKLLNQPSPNFSLGAKYWFRGGLSGQCFPASLYDPNGCSLRKVSLSTQQSLDFKGL